MAVLAEYSSGNDSYGRSANALISGIEAGQSIMARKQAMRLREEQNQRDQFKFEAQKPVIIANAYADIASAKASVDNATRQEMLRAQAAKESTAYNDEFLRAMRYDSRFDVEASDGTPEGDQAQQAATEYATQETLDTRSQKLAELKSKIGWMSLLPEYKGFVDTVSTEANKAHLEAAGNSKLTELMATAKTRADVAKYAADAGVVKEGIKADARRTSAELYSGSRERIAEINSDTKLSLQERQAKINAEKQGAMLADLNARAVEADQQAAEASAAGDEQTAALHRQVASSYRDAVQKNTTFAGQTPQPVPTKSPAVRPHAAPAEDRPPAAVSISIPGADVPTPGDTQDVAAPPPVAPVKVDPKATTVEIGGKTYPIFKDKNGKRAYKVDGHFVPIDTQ